MTIFNVVGYFHGMRECIICHKLKEKSAFSSDKSRKDGLESRCRPCNVIRNKKYDQTRSRFARYGVNKEWFLKKIIQQEYKCEICGKELSLNGKSTHIDHDHSNGRVRGLLCNVCNNHIIFALESPLLDIAREYLKKYSS